MFANILSIKQLNLNDINILLRIYLDILFNNVYIARLHDKI